MTDGNTQLLVVGCPRGGTSLIAQYLGEIGLRTVEDGRTNPDYPAGFTEHLPILLFNKACERLRGARDRLTDDQLIQPEFLSISCMKKMFDDAFSVFSDPDIDFVKSPSLALAMDFMAEQFPHLRFLAIWRRPATSIESFYQREFGRFPGIRGLFYAIGVWNMYARRVIDFKARYPNLVDVVEADALVEGQSSLLPLLDQYGFAVSDRRELPETLQKEWRHSPGWVGRAAPVFERAFRLAAPRRLSPYLATAEHLRQLRAISM
jgi:hypothetical protein